MDSKYLRDQLDQIEKENNLQPTFFSSESNSLRVKKGLKEIRDAIERPVFC